MTSKWALTLVLGVAGVGALAAPAGAVLSGTNGRIVFIEGPAFGNTQLFLRTVTSSTGAGSTSPALATGLVQQHRHPTWSPDRTKVAFAQGPGGATGYDIYIFNLTTPGATPQNITNSSGVTDDRPAWSPDGTRIAYESGNDIIVHPLNGGVDLNLTTTLTPKAWKAAWSPDSQTLYLLGRGHHPAAERQQQRHQALPAAGEQLERGDRAAPHPRRPRFPAVDLTRRDEALLHD